MGSYAYDALRWWARRPMSQTPNRRGPTIVTCRNCGAADLRWGKIAGDRWAVHDKGGSRHYCPIPLKRKTDK